MKLSQWAKEQGVCYQTAYNWFNSGKIPNSRQLDTGTILVDVYKQTNIVNRTCIYARVSNRDRKEELKYQINRISEFSNKNGYVIDKIYHEIASGMNDNRKELWKMLNSNPSKIVIENKDRLTRFGYNYLEKLLEKQGCEIIVMNRDFNDENDLMKDFISIITSFCCRLYGLRRGINKSKLIKSSIIENND